MIPRGQETRILSVGTIEFEYRAIASQRAQQIRVRVGPTGVEVVFPASRTVEDVEAFLVEHSAWVVAQLKRVSNLPSVRLARQWHAGTILLAGEPTEIRITLDHAWRGSNRVAEGPGWLAIRTGPSGIPPERTLENWLRRKARAQIEPLVERIAQHLGRHPRRIYVRDQRTRWGSCSSLGNLSFNWRLVMAPPHVLEYWLATKSSTSSYRITRTSSG